MEYKGYSVDAVLIGKIWKTKNSIVVYYQGAKDNSTDNMLRYSICINKNV